MNVCLDSCFLIGLYDERDEHHARSQELFLELFDNSAHNIAIIIWPVMYESVSTRLVKSRDRTLALERDWRKLRASNQLEFVEDAPYRDDAFDRCLAELEKPYDSYRPLSLTDRVLRSVLADKDLRVDAIATFNFGDFYDVCKKSRRQLVG